MNDVYKLLRQKETDLERVRQEIECLQIVAPMLSDDELSNEFPTKKENSSEKELRVNDSQATGTDNLFTSMNPVPRPSFWDSLKWRR